MTPRNQGLTLSFICYNDRYGQQIRNRKGADMTTELNPTKQEDKKVNVQVRGGSSDTVYALGLFGAWAYYIGRAATTEEKVKGFFKGFVWPAFLVYELFKFLEK
jgi:hypothetical protein